MILAAQIYQVPRLRKSVAVFLLPLYAFTWWTGTNLSLLLSVNLYGVSNGFERMWTEPVVF